MNVNVNVDLYSA